MREQIDLSNEAQFIVYTGIDGSVRVEVKVSGDTVWLTQLEIADLFLTSKQNVSYHIGNVLKGGELDELSTVKEILTVQLEGSREVSRYIEHYNLDMIIAVGYRVDSYNATQFRVWATKILKEYMIKGFALDDDRLKQGKTVFGKDHFKELVERVKEIRVSERRFYQQVTDLYQLSEDYDPKSPITRDFFATVQNKLEYAVTKLTAAEIIKKRASAKLPYMGLQTWSKPAGKIILKDVRVAKNYLKEEELDELKSLVNSYLDFAELQAKRQKIMTMRDWVEKLDSFLRFNEYGILTGKGTVSHGAAEKHAEKEYEKFRIIQDKEYKSDFDKIASKIVSKHRLPTEREMLAAPDPAPLSDFNQKLNTALNYNPKDKGKQDEE